MTHSDLLVNKFSDILKSSKSYLDFCSQVGINPSRSLNQKIHYQASKLGLDLSHWSRRTRKLEDCLLNKAPITSSQLKPQLWEAGLKPKQCEICGLTEWCGKPAPLALDHINGNNADNRLENLRILCHNCHAQTDTYAGRNKGRLKEATVETIYLQLSAPSGFILTTDRSLEKRSRKPRITWPSLTVLAELVESMPIYKLAKVIGVSDRGIKKYCDKHGIPVTDHRGKKRNPPLRESTILPIGRST